MNIQKGNIIRGYDFKPMAGRGDCFVEGIVLECNAIVECGYNAYKIRVTKDVFDGVELKDDHAVRVGQTVFVPWRVSFNEFQGRVMNLSA